MKKNRIVLIFVLLTIIYSCNFYSPVKKSLTPMKNVIVKPEVNQLVGNWVIDSFSNKFIMKHYEMEDKKILLSINEDGSLLLENIPDLNTLDNKKTNDLYNLAGKWELTQFKKEGKWYFDFNLIKYIGLNTTSHLYYKNGNLVIVNYVGDPDEGNRILFEKL